MGGALALDSRDVRRPDHEVTCPQIVAHVPQRKVQQPSLS